MQTSVTLGSETTDPTMRALARDPHRFRDMRDRHPLLNPFNQQAPAMNSQTSITVSHRRPPGL